MRTHFIQPNLISHRAASAGALINGGIEKIKMVIPADVAAIEKVSACVNELLASKQWPVEEVMKVELAVQEALANAIRHGCKNDASKLVDCGVTLNAGELLIVVRDPGPGFDVKAVAQPARKGQPVQAGRTGRFPDQPIDGYRRVH